LTHDFLLNLIVAEFAGVPDEPHQINHPNHSMKRTLIPLLAGVLAMTLLTGCLNLELGGGSTTKPQTPTLGQQLIDLQKAKDAGAISDTDYQAQKAKLLNSK
jgi:hypothetical protein